MVTASALGRIYVKLDEDRTESNYEQLGCRVERMGGAIVAMGLSHVLDFKVNDFELGTKASTDSPPRQMPPSQVKSISDTAADRCTVTFDAAAYVAATSRPTRPIEFAACDLDRKTVLAH